MRFLFLSSASGVNGVRVVQCTGGLPACLQQPCGVVAPAIWTPANNTNSLPSSRPLPGAVNTIHHCPCTPLQSEVVSHWHNSCHGALLVNAGIGPNYGSMYVKMLSKAAEVEGGKRVMCFLTKSVRLGGLCVGAQ
jgi:hypothetical protein